MIHTGLVSVTFRSMTPEALVPLACRAGLEGIEWGGDVHVPHGDTARAREVGRMTRDAGLAVSSYGSYYRAGNPVSADNPDFRDVLASAAALGAPVVRVWAGSRGWADAGDSYRRAVEEDSRRIAGMAAGEGVRVAYEYHGGTLTDERHGARLLMERAGHPNLFCYWQPPAGLDREEAAAGLRDIAPWLCHIHVFYWKPGPVRRPLAEGAGDWRRFLEIAAALPGDRYALLEFAMGDDPAQMIRDAGVLRNIIQR